MYVFLLYTKNDGKTIFLQAKFYDLPVKKTAPEKDFVSTRGEFFRLFFCVHPPLRDEMLAMIIEAVKRKVTSRLQFPGVPLLYPHVI